MPESGALMARVTLVVVSTLILVNLVAALAIAGFQIYYDGVIYPGVRVWDVDLSGMTPDEAQQALEGRFTYPTAATITFRDGTNVWPITAGELGVQFDLSRTVQAAYEVGRHPDLFTGLRQQVAAWQEGVVVSPVIVYDQRLADALLQQIASQINQPAVDATIQLNGIEVITTPSQIGREVDVNATLNDLGGLITSLNSGEVAIHVVESEPQVVDISATALTLNTLFNSDLDLYIENPLPGDAGPWTANRASLANMVILELVPSASDPDHMEYAVRLDENQLSAMVAPLADDLYVAPISALFEWDDALSDIVPITASSVGRELNVEASVANLASVPQTGTHQVPLVFNTLEPDYADTVIGIDLGITEMVSSATTYFAGSSQSRHANVEEAASRFNGIIIKPGQTFSFNEYLGDVSEETGFEEALIIFNGRTIPGVGGGVCQVSSTAFQAAFYAGFPIIERLPHGYRVGYYEVGEGAGMDATVYWPLVDMKFINDTDYHLLIETAVDHPKSQLTFRFYSTSDGRSVVKDGPYITNIVPHGPPIYEENSELAPGQVKKVDYAVDGADVTVHRTVYRNGAILYQDTFLSQYIPWQAIYQVAPGYTPTGS
jgi:vancomycin resistance protein YoaR